ncbi:TetR/AcrR family transcriptional regulator [Novosphingobium sp. PASSN1]|uniref:TetR/AcrR family transcriptional regulator n=1 Tax=Novosphingobium sp. PASSN1 TaxID=2015561 RepID=UPI000BD5B60F|nr:TetR/AcrR family transcriptional regulator [Novosphingobium sp. PASSN1]OYU34193.1 MAG: hypothetical protein CFE35_16385 [Novosphingobium sp. PASSN1]
MRKPDPDLQSRRRQEIIDGATRCFTANGFHQSSMADISAAAGLSMGLLYRYFPSKTAIIDAVAQGDRDAMIAAVAALPDHGTVAADWTRLLVATILEVTAPGAIELLNEIHAEAGHNPALLAQLRHNDSLLLAAIRAKLDHQGVPQPDGAAMLLVALVEGLAVRRYLMPGLDTAALTQLVARGLAPILAAISEAPTAAADPAGA